MLPELLRFSSASRLLELIPEELQNAHRTDAPAAAATTAATTAASAATRAPVAAASADVWDGWADANEADGLELEANNDSDDGLDLTEMGL